MKKVALKKKFGDFDKQKISKDQQKKIKGGTGGNTTSPPANDIIINEDITP